MKTNFSIVCAPFFMLGVLSGCNVLGDSVKPSKEHITRDYEVKDFNKIDASTVGDIHFTQSTDGRTTVQIYGPRNIVELIQVAVKKNTLLLSIKPPHKVRNTKNMTITISSPKLERIAFQGVGNIKIESALTTTKLEIENKGVGNIEIGALTCDELIIDSKGVGNIALKGKARSAILSSKGVGNVDAQELEAMHVDAQSKGVGDVSCFATESLKASVQGVGNIEYKGSPKEKDLNKAGIGKIKEI